MSNLTTTNTCPSLPFTTTAAITYLSATSFTTANSLLLATIVSASATAINTGTFTYPPTKATSTAINTSASTIAINTSTSTITPFIICNLPSYTSILHLIANSSCKKSSKDKDFTLFPDTQYPLAKGKINMIEAMVLNESSAEDSLVSNNGYHEKDKSLQRKCDDDNDKYCLDGTQSWIQRITNRFYTSVSTGLHGVSIQLLVGPIGE